MDQLPVEVIGNILSHLGEAQYILIASATCRKWQVAWRNHVHTLSFKHWESRIYRELTTRKLEILITETICQTNGLQSLSIWMGGNNSKFSDAAVVAWLMHTRETLRELYFDVRTDFNILERCGMLKLEVLNLKSIYITVVESRYKKLKCLKSLTLCMVRTSASALSLVLAACPRIESLKLICPRIEDSAESMMKMSSCSLKEMYVRALNIGKFTLEADNLEKLLLASSKLQLFELIGKGNLKNLSLHYVCVDLFNLGDNTKNLEVVDIISWSAFYDIIQVSSNIKKLQIMEVDFRDKDDILDLGIISMRFPRLIELSLDCEFARCDFLHVDWACLEDLVVLELKVTVNGNLPRFVGEFLEKCPNLKKLIIYGMISHITTQKDCNRHSRFTSSIIQLVRKHMQVEVSLRYLERCFHFRNSNCTKFCTNYSRSEGAT